ncbi:neuropeptides capa receptor [Biomphalaria glabrata]|nr:neuropeptides capa receptor-like [Biomphalaria glabrata]
MAALSDSHIHLPNTSVRLTTEILSDQETWLAMKILMFGITPIISVFGIVGNILSIIILVRHGMAKCSNILLVALALSDITFLISFNSLPKVLYEAVWNHEYVGYSKASCDVLFILFSIFTLLDYTFGLLGITLPMLITAERLVVIFLPLNFSQVLTPTRTWLAVFVMAAYWLSICIYSSFWQGLDYFFDPARNQSVGIIVKSAFFFQHEDSVDTINHMIIFSSMVIPPIFTVTGCVVISVKIQLALIKRQKMTSTTRSMNRTTRTLLAVCAIYCVTAAVLSMPLYLPQEYASYSLTDKSPTNMGKLFYQLVNTVTCINSSSNFIVYVGLNKQFRMTLKNIIYCSK